VVELSKLVQSLVRWSQYRWENEKEYRLDISLLSDTYKKCAVHSDSVFVLYRGLSNTQQPNLKFLDGSFASDILHQCWSTSELTATRFAVRKVDGFVTKATVDQSKILFDLNVLTQLLPSHFKAQYYDLQNLEMEVVLTPTYISP